MLFFDVDFLLLFLIPVAVAAFGMKFVGLRAAAPWFGVAASLVFLAAANWVSVAAVVASLALNFWAGRYLLHSKDKRFLIASIVVNLLILAYFKYSILIAGTFLGEGALPITWQLALPLGISFYTFQQIAFLSDIYAGKITSFTLRNYALFKLFFPQFIAGPIVHFERVRASYDRWPTFNFRSVKFGLALLSIGFIKKMYADYFGGVAADPFNNQSDLHMFSAWIGAVAFSFQIYFDFSGYSDMAVGLARIFGVSLPFNFNSPYKARSIPDFWRRWHITLSSWLRDYLYIPLGGNRHGKVRMFVALFLTMALGGLWHGAAWTFLAWGVAHGLSQVFIRTVRIELPRWVGHMLLLLFVLLTWILFRSASFSGALSHYAALVNFDRVGLGVEVLRLINLAVPFLPVPETAINRPEQISQLLAVIAAGIVCLRMPNSQQISLWFAARRVHQAPAIELPALCALAFLISLAFISPDTANAFIYFEF